MATAGHLGTRRTQFAVGGAIVALHVVGFALLALVVTSDVTLSDGRVYGIGLGITAYTLGMRHAFDADHIAAIDNATRTLVTNRRSSQTVGFWFSLGHSTVVFGLCALIALGVKALAGQVDSDTSTLQQVTSIWGTSVSGLFLVAIGLLNLVVLVRVIALFRRTRTQPPHQVTAQLDAELRQRGLFNRFIGKSLRAVKHPAQMYPVGFLFGLGFDTATEVSLLVLASAAAVSLPWYAIMCLPILFTAGMTLFDTIDSALMTRAYSWADERPARRLYYTVTVTGLSVVVALLIGGIELLGLLADKLHVTSGPLAAIAAVDLEYVGYIVVGLFLATWLGAMALWRFGRMEERLSRGR